MPARRRLEETMSQSDSQGTDSTKIDGYSDYLRWNRDAQGRLYYAFWIIFIGGFVYSLKVPNPPGYWIVALFAFRVLAIAGAIVNFYMQDRAISACGNRELVELYTRLENTTSSAKYQSAMEGCDKWVEILERPLQIIAGAYLLLALTISFHISLGSHYERLEQGSYLYDSSTGKVCNPLKDPKETSNIFDRATGAPAAKYPDYPPSCGK